MYVIAKDKPFYFGLIILNMFLWYPLRDGKTYKKIYFCFSALLRITSLLVCLGTLTHLILTIKYDTGIDISEDIGDLVSFVGCMWLCLVFLIYHSKWTNFFNNLLDFKHFGKPPKYDEVVKRGNIISLLFMFYTLPGMLRYCHVSYMQVPECKENNAQKGLNEACGMVNPTWIPIEQHEGILYLLCYFFQVTGIFVYLPSGLAVCNIPWEAVELIVARINHLKILFRDVFESDDRKQCVVQLHFCISYHQDILKISEELNNLVRTTIASIFLTSAIVIGSLGSQVLNESTPKAIIFIMGYISAAFIICHAGQRLIDESLDLTDCVYASRWYEMDTRIKKDVAIVLMRCQKPIIFTAPASMGVAGYVMYGAMIKTSYSYLTLLNQAV